MASISRRILSGSTNGRPITVTATSSPGTSLNVASATTINMVTLMAKNTATVAREYRVEWGGTGTESEIIGVLQPRDGLYMIADNLPISGTTATIAAYATATSGVQFLGYVDAFT